ncbi:flavin reductase family protein [Alkalithermobacter paradoxus]|uniref:Flavoredoxin n=1 Tax=Alkalithermobacter paradoxus TaxID=29349 RepID=A0A1V4I7K3_9FIRM|nr:flavoredoxin [[Clostridium] thermoalcaliphilum]
MREMKFSDMSKEMLEQLQRGAFITVKDKDGNTNTMTIAWGSIGYMWNKPIFTAMVRYSRYTYDIIERSNEFTVSFPINNDLKNELSICGRKSGRDIDKFKDCNLNPLESKNVDAPIIKECDLYMECKVVYKQEMNEDGFLDNNVKDKCYPDGDYHVLYYGEILSVYMND